MTPSRKTRAPRGRVRTRNPPRVIAQGSRLPSEREQALFEAGIKLGGIFHQFIGVPVAARTAASLAQAIEEAVGLQPFVISVRVSIDPARGGPAGTGRFGYRYLVAEMLHAEVQIRVGRAEVSAALTFREDLNYPLMHVLSVTG